MIGTVYLLHLEPGLPVTRGRIARHYLGWTAGEDVGPRLEQHLAGRGSPLVAAVIAAGGTATLTRTWPRVDRHFERRLKRRHETPRLCPCCVAAGHTRARRPLLTDRPAPVDDEFAGAGALPHRCRRGHCTWTRFSVRPSLYYSCCWHRAAPHRSQRPGPDTEGEAFDVPSP